jgi:hypothetical protein
LVACEYISDVHNICADESISYQIPKEARHGGIQDISAFLEYKFYEEILYLDSDETFPSMKEKPGWWVGVAQNVGDAMKFKILTEDTKKIIICSIIRPAKNNHFQNKWVQFEPTPDEPDDDAECGMLTYGPRRLKIDQGLSKCKKSKQLCHQQRHPASMLPLATPTLADWTVPNPSEEDLSSPPTSDPAPTPPIAGEYSGENHEALEHVPDDSAVPSTNDASTPDPIDGPEVDTEPNLTSRRSHQP